MKERLPRTTWEEKIWFEGWCAAIDSVKASIVDYPEGGGDIGIMKELDKLVDREARF